MKLLTLNFLTCARKACKQEPAAFPLHPRDADLERVDQELNPEFLINVLPRLDWKAIKSLSEEVKHPTSASSESQMLTKTVYSSASQPSPTRHPKNQICSTQKSNPHKHYKICTHCWWRQVSQMANWFAGIVDTSMRSRKALPISCCRVIWYKRRKSDEENPAKDEGNQGKENIREEVDRR